MSMKDYKMRFLQETELPIAEIRLQITKFKIQEEALEITQCNTLTIQMGKLRL